MVDYIYLDTDERRRFAQSSHEYLIEQLQIQNNSSTAERLPITSASTSITHARTCLDCWQLTQLQRRCCRSPSAQLKLNGHDRFAVRKADYFQLVQPHQAHTTVAVGSGINVQQFRCSTLRIISPAAPATSAELITHSFA